MKQGLHELHSLDGVLGVQGQIAIGVLLVGAKRVHKGAHGHGRIDLLGQADAHGDVVLLFDLAAAVEDFVPTVRHDSDVVPEVLAPVDGIRRKGRREAEVFLGFRIVGAFDREIDGLAVFLLALRVDIFHVDHLLLVERRRPVEEEYIVTFLCGHLGRRAGADPGDADVVHGHFRVVLIAPLLDIFLVEPLVEGGDEVHPLKNFQSFLRGSAVRAPRQNQGRTQSSSERPSRGRFNEIASGESPFCHSHALPFCQNFLT